MELPGQLKRKKPAPVAKAWGELAMQVKYNCS